MPAETATESIESIKIGLLRRMWTERGGGTEGSEIAEMACEEAATRMVSITEWFATRVGMHQRSALEEIARISDKAIADAEAKRSTICGWLGIGARSSADAREIVARLIHVENAAIIEDARHEMGLALGVNEARHKLDEARLRSVLDRIEARLSKALGPAELRGAASQAGSDAEHLLAALPMRAR